MFDFNLSIIPAGILSLIVSYLLGSCNSSIIGVRLIKHEDIRKQGSGNAGLTNTFRCYGKGMALVTLIGDLLKGVVAVLLSILIFKLIAPTVMTAGDKDMTDINMAIGYCSGIAAILGHIFPIYYGFKGGKGVLVSSSILLVIDPLTFAIIIPFFILMIAVTRYVSVASIISAVFYPILTFLLHFFVLDLGFNWSLVHTLLTVCTSILLIFMHRENIKRLRSHKEIKFTLHRKKSD
jgi:glycerol-3-phosphate acyltransferase PlsY